MGAAWGGRVGNLWFEPAVLPYVVKVEVVVQVVLWSKEGTQEISALLERKEWKRTGLQTFVIDQHLLSVEELSSKQDEFVLLRVGAERRVKAGNTNHSDVSGKERSSALFTRPNELISECEKPDIRFHMDGTQVLLPWWWRRTWDLYNLCLLGIQILKLGDQSLQILLEDRQDFQKNKKHSKWERKTRPIVMWGQEPAKNIQLVSNRGK